MAFKLAEAFVELSTRGFTSVTANIASTTRGFVGMGQAVESVSQRLRSMLPGVGQLLASLGAGLGAAGMVKAAADMEQLSVSMEVLTGSAEEARRLLTQMTDFAARTPFTLPGLTEAAQTMLAFSVPAHEVMNSLSMISEVAMGNEQRLASLALVYGQIASAGRLTGQDLLQLVNVGFNPLLEISRRTGESLNQLRDRMSQGGISFQEVRQAFIDATSEGGKFHRMNERMSQTLVGLWSTLKDSILSAARDIGAAITKAFNLKEITADSAAFVAVWKDRWLPTIEMALNLTAGFFGLVRQLVGAFSGFIPVILGTIAAYKGWVLAQRAVAAAQTAVLALSGPKGWAVLAAGTAVGIAATAAIKSEFDKLSNSIRQTQTETTKETKELQGLARESRAAAAGLQQLNQEIDRPSPGKKVYEETRKQIRELQHEIDVMLGRSTDATRALAEMLNLPVHFTQEDRQLAARGVAEVAEKIRQRDALREEQERLKQMRNEAEQIRQNDPVKQFRDREDELLRLRALGLITTRDWVRETEQARRSAFGITPDALTQYRERVSEIRRAAQQGLLRRGEAERLQREALPSSIASLMESMKTPAERLAEQISELRQFRAAGALTDEQYVNAVAQLRLESQPQRQGGFVGLADYANRIQESALRTQTDLLRQQLAAQIRIAEGIENRPGPMAATAG